MIQFICCAFGCVNKSFALFQLDRTDVMCTLCMVQQEETVERLVVVIKNSAKEDVLPLTPHFIPLPVFQEIGSL